MANIDPQTGKLDKPWAEWTWEALADEAQIGRRGQGAVVESNRRMVDAVNKLNDSTTWQQKTTNRLTCGVASVTAVIAVLTIVQVTLLVKDAW